MKHKRLALCRFDQAGQLVLAKCRVDVRVPRVVENPKQTVQAHVDARRLHHGVVESRYPDVQRRFRHGCHDRRAAQVEATGSAGSAGPSPGRSHCGYRTRCAGSGLPRESPASPISSSPSERCSCAKILGKSFTEGDDFDTPVLINGGRGHRRLKARLIMFGKHVDRR